MANPISNDALLSTLTQSGAALVAIIAGLLVARLVTLVGERDTWRRRINEMLEVRKEREEQVKHNAEQWLSYDGRVFMQKIQREIIRRSDVQFDDLYERHSQGTRSADELRPYFDACKSEVTELRVRIATELSGGIITDWFHGGKEGFLRSYPQDKRDLAEDIAEAVMLENDARSKRRADSFGTRTSGIASWIDSVNTNPAHVARMQRSWQIRDEFSQEDDHLRSELRMLDLELSHAKRALDSVSTPGGLLPAFVALSLVAITGMVIPLVAMAVVQRQLSALARVSFVALFLVSVVIFLAYLIFEAARLVRRHTS